MLPASAWGIYSQFDYFGGTDDGVTYPIPLPMPIQLLAIHAGLTSSRSTTAAKADSAM